MVSGSKNNSGVHENVVAQFVNLYPRWPRVKTSFLWDSCSMMISVRCPAPTHYIINYTLIMFIDCFGSHFNDEERNNTRVLWPDEHRWSVIISNLVPIPQSTIESYLGPQCVRAKICPDCRNARDAYLLLVLRGMELIRDRALNCLGKGGGGGNKRRFKTKLEHGIYL